MGSLIDLTGQKFGRLTVLSYKGNRVWECKCDCGTIKDIVGENIRSGGTKSCGCLNDDNKRRYKDLTGQRFGRLVVVKRAKNYVSPSGKSKQLRWICKCDCGEYCVVNSDVLKNGRTKSCGCLQKENLNKINKHGAIKKNEYEVSNGIVFVAVKNSTEKVLCDLEDWEYLKKYYWNLNSNGYVVSVIKGKSIPMHKIIMPDKKFEVVDHINRNKMDNRKDNLRYTTYMVNAQNRSLSSRNTSGHTGVYKFKNKWQASIKANNKTYFLGYFQSKEEAIVAREKAEKIYHKEKFK